jgi:hypothetical protein
MGSALLQAIVGALISFRCPVLPFASAYDVSKLSAKPVNEIEERFASLQHYV